MTTMADDNDEVYEPLLIDKLLMDKRCFDKPCPTWSSMERIWNLVVLPNDPSGSIVNSRPQTLMASILQDHEDSQSLLINNCHSCYSTTDTLPSVDAKQELGTPAQEMTTATTTTTTASETRELCLSNSLITSLQDPCLSNIESLILWKCAFLNFELHDAMPELKCLVLVDTDLPSYVTLGKMLAHFKSLERLILIRASDSPYSAWARSRAPYFSPQQSFKLLSEGLSRLTQLSLHQTDIGDEWAFAISQVLRGNDCQLEELELREIHWSSPVGCMAVADGVRENATLVKLDVSKTGWNVYRGLLTRTLRNHASLEELKLESMPDIISWIDGLQAVRQNPRLLKVSLAENSFRSRFDWTPLSEILSNHVSLQRIDLSSCNTDDPSQWSSALLHLAHNNHLQSLSLEGCSIGSPGAETLGRVLLTNQTLRVLDLCQNSISTEGCRSLVHGLQSNQALQQLFLYDNAIGEEGADLLCDMLRTHNRTLRIVFLPEYEAQQLNLQTLGAMNYVGRKYLCDSRLDHPALWPWILERAAKFHPDTVWYLLQQKPELLRKEHQNVGRKRAVEEISSAD